MSALKTDSLSLKTKAHPLAHFIDHTKLTYGAGEDPDAAVQKLCAEACRHGFFAVCVRPDMIQASKAHLQGSDVKVATVIGFPAGKTKLADELQSPTIGNVPLALKMRETVESVNDGADELDLVMNVAQFKAEASGFAQATSGGPDVGQPCSKANPGATLAEFSAIRELCPDKTLKIIIETDLLTPEEIRRATLLCAEAGADFVKTSTGMVDGGQGATVDNIRFIRETLDAAGFGKTPERGRKFVQIKASGGVNTADQAQALIAAGATRLGASKGVAIVTGAVTADPGGY